ncbi:MAG: helix-turn-helix domain-containing protein [Desulfitobacteriaceae bacterium]
MHGVHWQVLDSRGKRGGRKPKLDNNKKKAIYELYQQKKTTVKDICAMFDITKPTLYHYSVT